MANFYWSATAGATWNTNNTGNKWSSDPNTWTAPAAAAPRAQDDVFFGAGSLGAFNCTLAAGDRFCRSINFTGYTNTFNHTTGNLNIGDGTAGAGGIAIKVPTGMTYTRGGPVNLLSTSGTLQTITWSNVISPQTFTINGGTSSNYELAAPLAVNGVFTITQGGFSTSSSNHAMTLTGGIAISNANVRSINLNGSTVTLGLGLGWDLSTTTNLTASFTNSTIVLIVLGGANPTFAGGGLSYGTLTASSYASFTTGAFMVITGSNTFVTLNALVTDTSARTADLVFADGTTQTITSGLNIGGNSSKSLTVRSQTGGTQFTLSKGVSNVAGGKIVTADYINLIDGKAIGEAKFFATNSVNNGNNVNWRFNSPMYGSQSLLGCGI